MKIKQILPVLTAVFLISCATKPVEIPDDTDPLAFLPEDEDFYLLVRPSEHTELSYELLREHLPADSGDIYPALERTETAIISGRFNTAPLSFSGKMEGDYPAFFLRRSFRKSPDWEKYEDKTYIGPGAVLADTLYKDTLIAASEGGRLAYLQDSMNILPTAIRLSEEDKEWWLSGSPAVLLFLPQMAKLPLPQGLTLVPEDSVLILSFTPGLEGQYVLNGEIRLPDSRSARFWTIGLRVFLGGRLGLSEYEEERTALQSIEINTKDSIIQLDHWSMSSQGWGVFLSSFRTAD